jgi:hypothetical protein
MMAPNFQVVMKAVLSGMPECKLGLNDKLVLDKDGGGGRAAAAAAGAKKKASGVELDDVQFHRCVQLGKFDADRTITFVPPDGEFELMRYRITDNVNLPFRVIPVIEEQGKSRVVMNIKAIANFSNQLCATNVVFKIPVRFELWLSCCASALCLWIGSMSLYISRRVLVGALELCFCFYTVFSNIPHRCL